MGVHERDALCGVGAAQYHAQADQVANAPRDLSRVATGLAQ
jgi:hypothetical protein